MDSNLVRTSMNQIVETRISASATANPTMFDAPDQALFPKFDSARSITEGYLAQTYVYKCVDKCSSSIARLAYRTGRNPDNPTKYMKNSQLAGLLGPEGRPNPDWTPRMFWKYIISQFLIMGKFACQIERAGGKRNGRIIALWPLQAQHLRPIPSTGNNPDGYFSAFEYGNYGHRGYRKFKPWEVLYCYRPSLDDFRQPESVMEAAGIDISVAQMINQYDFALLRNNAVPSTLVTHERFEKPQDRRAFRSQFMAKFSGPNNAGKTMFLEADPDYDENGKVTNNVAGKVHVERLALNANEMQSQDKRASTINDICVAFGTPLSILGDSTRSKFTNMESDFRNWWTDTLLPLADYVCDLINVQLARNLEGSYKGWFDFSSVPALKQPSPHSLSDLLSAMQADAIDRDELRRQIGLEPWDEVDHPEVEEAPVAEPLVVAAPPARPALKSGPSVPVPNAMQKTLTATVRHSLTQQKIAVSQRANGLRGSAQGLTSVFDKAFWSKRMQEDLIPVFEGLAEYRSFPSGFVAGIATRIIEDSHDRLNGSDSVDAAYNDIDGRAEAISQTVIRMLEEIPADDLVVLLEAVRQNKLTPAKALELIA